MEEREKRISYVEILILTGSLSPLFKLDLLPRRKPNSSHKVITVLFFLLFELTATSSLVSIRSLMLFEVINGSILCLLSPEKLIVH